METQELLEKLTKAVAFKFKEDGTVPGVTTAFLKDGRFYCSVVRYGSQYVYGKSVVCSSIAPTLNGAIQNTAKEFLRIAVVVLDPIQDLDSLVRIIA